MQRIVITIEVPDGAVVEPVVDVERLEAAAVDPPSGGPVTAGGDGRKTVSSGGDGGNGYHRWTPEERAYLVSVYGEKEAAVVARELGLASRNAVYSQLRMLKKAGFLGLTCGDCSEAEKEPGETTYCSLEQGIVRKDRLMCYEQILSRLREAGQ